MDIIRSKLRTEPISEEKKHRRVLNRQVHMANERTFLAWIRTGIGIMAFGFVVVKFALFVKQMAFVLENTSSSINLPAAPRGYSAILGILLVALGALMSVLGFFRYKITEKQIDEETYRPTFILDALLTLAVLAVGIFLVIYLVHSI